MNANQKLIVQTLVLLFVGIIVIGAAFSDEVKTQYASGVVFYDKNGNGIQDRREKGVRGVGVSNGREVVLTDKKGRYYLPVSDDTILFVIKPQDWNTPVNEENLPQFYYIHKPGGSPKLKYPGVAATGPLPPSVDFPLVRHQEPKKFKAVIFGDTQPSSQQNIDYLAHDVVEELIGTDAAFGVTLGDIVSNDLSLFENVNCTVGSIGIPWYNVIGNHDLNFDAPDVPRSDETYERVYGPSHYAFNYGQVHFLVLHDIFLDVEAERYRYHAQLGDEQLAFVENDLRYVPKERLVVVMTHIPLMQVRDREKLFALLQERPHTFSLAAHWHRQEHFFLGADEGWQGREPLHSLVHVTACGGWWGGWYDEVELPHGTMSDGVPNGYSIITFDENQYEVQYRAARRPADYQMNIFAPEVVKTSEAGETEVVVNVFAGSERSVVQMRFDDQGEWMPMTQYEGEDPSVTQVKEREQSLVEKVAELRNVEEVDRDLRWSINREYRPILGPMMPRVGKTRHLWKAKLPAEPAPGYHLIEVRTTDMFGHTYEASRVIRVE